MSGPVAATPVAPTRPVTATEPLPADAAGAALADYLAHRWGGTVVVSGVARMPGGNARTTWRCDAEHDGTRYGLVFRLASGGGLNLSEFRREYDALELAHRLGHPVPRLWVLEQDPRWLGAAFAVMEELPGLHCVVSGFALDTVERDRIGRSMWTVLGGMAARPVGDVEVPASLRSAGSPAAEQLAAWSADYLDSEIHPDPVAHAAIRWLDAHLPPPPRHPVLVHGDYRIGNLLYDDEGRIVAAVDWEMSHVGDPLEDLAWSLDPRQDANRPESACGLLGHAEAVRVWQEASGLDIDPAAMHWWQVFVALRGLTIWSRSAHLFATSPERRPFDGRMGWLLLERQRRVLVDLLSPVHGGTYYRYTS